MSKIEKKYVLHGGFVYSQNDGDKHYISADKLIGLYGLNRRECVVAPQNYHPCMGRDKIHLYPRSNGDYKLRAIEGKTV